MDNYFMLDGKKIPMSKETTKSLREQQKVYVPIARTAYLDNSGPRLILRITRKMRAAMAYHPLDDVFTFEADGRLSNSWPAELEPQIGRGIGCYSTIVTVFQGEQR